MLFPTVRPPEDCTVRNRRINPGKTRRMHADETKDLVVVVVVVVAAAAAAAAAAAVVVVVVVVAAVVVEVT